MSRHVFVSYSRKDQDYARKLVEELQKRGFEVWVDDRIDFGDRWWREIDRAIRTCAAFVVVMTPNSDASRWVQKEVHLAIQEGKPMFPLLLRGREHSLVIDVQYANVVGGRMPPEDFYDRLREAVPAPYVPESPPAERVKKTPIVRRLSFASVIARIWRHVSVLKGRSARVVLTLATSFALIIGCVGAWMLVPGVRQLLYWEPLPVSSVYTLTLTATAIPGTMAPTLTTVAKTPSAARTPTRTATPRRPTPTPTSTATPTPVPPPTATHAATPTSTATSVRPGELLGDMISIPAGEFTMSGGGESHQVYLDAFNIGKYEVTNAQYKRFVEATGHRAPEHWSGGSIPEGKENHPVVWVGWDDAVAYCEWLGEETGQVVRLPTEAQWEKAARGTDARWYPWGDEFEADRCNSLESGTMETTPVGQYSPLGDSPYGVADMAGNVLEWTSSLYWDYPYNADDGREDPEAEGSRALRGGSFRRNAEYVRCHYRYITRPDYRYDHIGFRVVVSLGSP